METFTRCIKCGAEKTTAKECPACGVIYAKAEQSYQEPPLPLAPCGACEKEISINAAACPHCGEPRTPAEPPQITEAKPVGKVRFLLMAGFLAGFFILLVYSQFDPDVTAYNALKVEKRTPPNFVSSGDYGDKWPYTIPEGRLSCTSTVVAGYQKQYVTIEHEGVTYAINGSARSTGRYQPLEKIWRENPAYPGSKIPDPGIIQKALELCD